MTVGEIDLQQIEQEFETVDHKVKYQQNGSQWECRAKYVGNMEEYKGTVTNGDGETKLAAARDALDKVRRNEPELSNNRQ